MQHVVREIILPVFDMDTVYLDILGILFDIIISPIQSCLSYWTLLQRNFQLCPNELINKIRVVATESAFPYHLRFWKWSSLPFLPRNYWYKNRVSKWETVNQTRLLYFGTPALYKKRGFVNEHVFQFHQSIVVLLQSILHDALSGTAQERNRA